jgi:hypothetical protein
MNTRSHPFTRHLAFLAVLVSLLLAPCSLLAVTAVTVVTPVSITATAGHIDASVSRLVGPARFTMTSLNTAGTSPTLALKLQGSADAARGLEYLTVGTTATELREGASTNIELALSFTQSGARSIKRVALYLDKEGTITAGKLLTLRIETDSASAPSGTLVTNGSSNTVDIDTAVSTTAGWVVFTFAKPVDLADATAYHYVLTGDYSASGSNNVRLYSKTVASGGTLNPSTDGTTYAGVTTTERVMVYVDQYTFTDITGGGFTSLATAGTAAVQTVELPAVELPAYVRLYTTIGGTSNPAWTTACVLNAQRAQEQ